MQNFAATLINLTGWLFFAYFLVCSIAIGIRCFVELWHLNMAFGSARDAVWRCVALICLPATAILFYKIATYNF